MRTRYIFVFSKIPRVEDFHCLSTMSSLIHWPFFSLITLFLECFPDWQRGVSLLLCHRSCSYLFINKFVDRELYCLTQKESVYTCWASHLRRFPCGLLRHSGLRTFSLSWYNCHSSRFYFFTSSFVSGVLYYLVKEKSAWTCVAVKAYRHATSAVW